ncbi:MAG: tRNA 2-thiouridine(34) synthase MnmA [Patescibacteria group bacterium]
MSQGSGKIIIGLSGGVDSAVAALLLQHQGYDVHGVFMKNWSADDFGGPCPWAEDQASAKAVGAHLNIPLVTWNFEREYRDRVFQVMLNEYRQGRTPNPDILCNREIKFSLFLGRALKEASFIATGHYARTKNGKLYKAADGDKDQSYFLAAVTGEALKQTLFPLGELKKPAVRQIAKDAGLPNWDRPDSTGICFIGEKKMIEFLSKYMTTVPGEIVLTDGTVVGKHGGLQFYTIGQRHGFSADLNQKKLARLVGAGKPMFVSAKNMEKNRLIIAPADRPEQLEAKEFIVSAPHWIGDACSFPWTGIAKFRYRQPDVSVTLLPAGDKLRVICQKPQRAITPGQYAVFYEGDECLGSAVIDNTS